VPGRVVVSIAIDAGAGQQSSTPSLSSGNEASSMAPHRTRLDLGAAVRALSGCIGEPIAGY
jgi:hypothetical protein